MLYAFCMNKKEEAKARRAAAQVEAAQKAKRDKMVRILGIIVMAAVAVVVVLVIATQGGKTNKKADLAVFTGVPQTGLVLGDPKAPYELTEYIDPQCPFCAEYSQGALPDVIRKWVKSGKLSIKTQPLGFLGPDSERGARAAVVASKENRFYQFMEVFYANQGAENTGYVTPDFLRETAKEASVKNVEALIKASDATGTVPELEAANKAQDEDGSTSTPTLFIEGKGVKRTKVELTSLESSEVISVLGEYIK